METEAERWDGDWEIKRGANTVGGGSCSPFIGPFKYFPSYVLFPVTRTFSYSKLLAPIVRASSADSSSLQPAVVTS